MKMQLVINEKPEHLSKSEWKKLLSSLLTPPLGPKGEWIQDEKTKQWKAVYGS